MKEEWKVTREDADQVVLLIHEYVTQGGNSLDFDALIRVADALHWADRIVFVNEGEEDEN